MLTFRFSGAAGIMIRTEVLTSGMVGKKVRLEFSEEWDGLTKTAVFMAGGVTRSVTGVSDVAAIPADVLARPVRKLYVGIYGVSADGAVTPTIRAEGPEILPGVVPFGDVITDPDLPVWAQLQVQLDALKEKISESNGDSGEISISRVDYAQVENKPRINGVELEGNKSLAELGISQPTDAQISEAVSGYLDAHPEATTTVQDGSITESKLSDDVLKRMDGNSVFAGKTASFFGDSLTEVNSKYTKGYHQWVKELLGLASYNNYGRSGYTFASMLTSMQNADDSPDIVFVMGGTNNQRINVPMGSLGDTTADTNYGQLYMLCKYAKEKYTHQPVIFITQHYQTMNQGSAGITAYQISRAMMEVCHMFAIPVYDNYVMSGMYPTNISLWAADGCHWNDKGHELVGRNLAKFVCDSCRYLYDGETDEGGGETEVTLTGITAAYTGGDVAVGTDVTALTGITVTAKYSDGSTAAVTGYTLSGTIAEGSNTITVSYGGMTATFTVTGIADSGGEDDPAPAMYTVTNTLTNVVSSNAAVSAAEGSSYTAVLTANNGYELKSVTVTMGGADVTANAYADGTVNIAAVSGNIVITAVATEISVELKAYNVTQSNVSDRFIGFLVESSYFASGDKMTTQYDESNNNGYGETTSNVSIFAYNSIDEFKAGTYAATCGAANPTRESTHPSVTASVADNVLAYPYLWLPIPYSLTTAASITIKNCEVLCNARRVPIVAPGSWKGAAVFEEIENT